MSNRRIWHDAHTPLFHCATCTCTSSIRDAVDFQSESTDICQLLRELDQLENRATALRARVIDSLRQRNSKAPVSQLPAEILGTIFLICRDDAVNIEWITVSHVVRAWRETALSFPSLWTSPDLLHVELAAEMLVRSRQTPVNLRLTESRTSLPLPVFDFSAVLARCPTPPVIHSLDCFSMEQSFKGLLEPLITRFAPTLRSVTIDDHGYRPSSWNIFSAEYPRLHTLNLRNIVPGWSATMCRTPSLRVLHVLVELQLTSYTMADIIGVLQGLSRLEDLALHYCLPEEGEPAETLDQHADLPLLQSLALSGSSDACSLLIGHLVYPPAIRTEFILTEFTEDQDIATALAITVPLDIPLIAVCLDYDKLKVLSSHESMPGSHPPAHLLHLLMPEYDPEDYSFGLSKIADALAASRATTLALAVRRKMANAPWTWLLEQSNATTVHFEVSDFGDGVEGILADLAGLLDDGGLQNIECLVIDGLRVVHSGEESELQAMIEALERRSCNGVFRRLEFLDPLGDVEGFKANCKTTLPEMEFIQGRTRSGLGQWIRDTVR